MDKSIAGHELKCATYRAEHVSEDELWSAFAHLFYPKLVWYQVINMDF